jgi:hypothetical protein
VSFSPVGYGNWVDTLIIESNDPVKPRLFVKLVGYSGNLCKWGNNERCCLEEG